MSSKECLKSGACTPSSADAPLANRHQPNAAALKQCAGWSTRSRRIRGARLLSRTRTDCPLGSAYASAERQFWRVRYRHVCAAAVTATLSAALIREPCPVNVGLERQAVLAMDKS
jgi:hypothetical protein